VDTARQLVDLADEDRDRIRGLNRAAMSELRMHRDLTGRPIMVSNSLVVKTGITPAAVKKSLEQKEENIEAYDLYFVIRNYGNGIDAVCQCLNPLLKEAETKKALEILSRDFVDPEFPLTLIHLELSHAYILHHNTKSGGSRKRTIRSKEGRIIDACCRNIKRIVCTDIMAMRPSFPDEGGV
jgi:hypothetical protein